MQIRPIPVRFAHTPVLLAVLSLPSAGLVAQAPAPASPTPAAPATPAPSPGGPAKSVAQPVADLLKPSLDALQQSIEGLRLEKWKGGSVRAEAERNISSITSDLQTTLPPLLTAADPAAVSRMLPVSRNIDALYDVVLRVFDAARVAAPGDQVAQLQQAMSGLEDARRTFNERLQVASVAQEKLVGDLQGRLRAQVVPVCPVQPAPATNCPATPAKRAVRRKAKPAVKPPANPPASTTTPKPSS